MSERIVRIGSLWWPDEATASEDARTLRFAVEEGVVSVADLRPEQVALIRLYGRERRREVRRR
jgi:hypothetical protein